MSRLTEKTIEFTYNTPEIGVIVVKRPDVKNAFNLATIEAFARIVEEISRDRALRVILFTGSEGSFTAGADIKEWIDYPDRAGGRKLAAVMGDALQKFSVMPTINIALINGPARGGGAEIATMCDMRIMSKNASIAFVHGKLGLIPGWGGGARLFQLLGYSKALELLSTAKILNAQEAQNFGLVNQIVEESLLFISGLKLAEDICKNPPQGIFAIKKHLYQMSNQFPEQAIQRERESFIDLWDTETRKNLFSDIIKKAK
jgi:enoyl-CoA hydratase/carnithine racemase